MVGGKRTVIEVSRGLMATPRIDERVALAIADDEVVKHAAAAAVDAEPRIIALTDEHARLPAYRFGVRADTGTDQGPALHAAFTYAEALGGGRTIELPPGRIRIDGTFSLAGYSSGMVGTTGSTLESNYGPGTGTVLYAIDQTGPVLDFAGYRPPINQKGRPLFADFNIEGDGTAGAAKMGISLSTGTNASSVDMQRITISNTGGVGFYVKDFYLSEFHAITVFDPVDCVATNTPYVLLEGANGNRFYGLGLRSSNHDAAVADTPVAGALRLIPGSAFQHHQTAFYGMWFENQRLPSNAALIVTQTNKVAFTDTQFFDCFKLAGATGTAHVRFQKPATQDYGGNVWRGLVPGKGTAAQEIDLGIDVSQNGTQITGPKGFGGTNVRLNAGVQWTHAELLGAEAAGNNLGFIDNSGNVTNTLIDGPMGIWHLGGRDGQHLIRLNGLVISDKYADLGNVAVSVGLNMTFGNNIFRFTLTGNTTMTVTYPEGRAGRRLTVMVRQDGTGGRLLTWPGNFGFHGGVWPTLSTAANRTDIFTFIHDGTDWREVSRAMGT